MGWAKLIVAMYFFDFNSFSTLLSKSSYLLVGEVELRRRAYETVASQDLGCLRSIASFKCVGRPLINRSSLVPAGTNSCSDSFL